MQLTERQLDVMQSLRVHARGITARDLAKELKAKPRDIDADIAWLRTAGADIQGGSETGYLLKADVTLPPMVLTAAELNALTFGMHLVQEQGSPIAAQAARDLVAKVLAVLPAEYQEESEGLEAFEDTCADEEFFEGDDDPHVADFESAIREYVMVKLSYQDGDGRVTTRTVWPIAMGDYHGYLVVAAYCELRQAFRHFRLDRMKLVVKTRTPIPTARAVLHKQWMRSVSSELD